METWEKLKALQDKDELEFKYHLRNLLKKSQSEKIDDFIFIMNEFKRELLYNSLFFIDILNENFFYFFLESREAQPNYEKLMQIAEIMAPIGDKDTLEVFFHILKKMPRHDGYYPILMNYYGEIEHKISFLEKKIDKFRLYPPKSLIVEWHE